jgi:hypothetical protein
MQINYSKTQKKTFKKLTASLLCVVCSFLFALNTHGQTVTVTYSNPGSFSVNIPVGATGVTGTAIGGGGGGGGASAKSYRGGLVNYIATAAAGGGGQGCIATGNLTAGTAYNNISVGAGGTAGNGNTNANGGTGGTSAIGAISANGGTGAVSGDFLCSGGSLGQGGWYGNGGAACSSMESGGKGSGTNCTPCQNLTGGKGGGSAANGGTNSSLYGIGNGSTGTLPGSGGGGGVARAQAPSDSYEQSAWYDANGGAGANGQVIVTFNLPQPTFTVSSPVCSGQPVTFTITGTVHSGVTYYLYKGNSREGTFSNNSCTMPVAAAGNYTVRAEYNNIQTGGTISVSGSNISTGTNTVTVTSAEQQVTVNTTPNITTNSFSICSGDNLNIVAGDLGTGIESFSWDAPTLTQLTATGPANAASAGFQTALTGILTDHSGIDGQTASYLVTPKSAAGCVGTPETVTVSVKTTPFITGYSVPALCGGASADLKPVNGNGNVVTASTEYLWTSSAGTGASVSPATQSTWSNNIEVTVNNNGVTQEFVTLHVRARRGNDCQTLETVFDITIPVNPKPSFTVTQPAAVCSPATVDISTAISALQPVSSTVKYYNSYANPNLGGEFTDPTNTGAGTYYVQAVSSDNCKSDVESVTVTVNLTPVISGAAAVCEGSTIQLSTTVAGGIWTIANGTGSASIDNSTGEVTGITAGTATVTYTVNGCSDTYNITVNGKPVIRPPIQTTFCAGETFAFALTNTTGLSGSWSFVTPPVASAIDAITGDFIAGNITLGQSPLSVDVQYTTTNGCVSSPQTLTVKYTPAAPAVTNLGIECQDLLSSASIVWADRVSPENGATLQWWNDAMSPIVEPFPVPYNTVYSATTYYVSQEINGCQSSTSAITIEINANPNINDIMLYNECQTLSGSSMNIETDFPAYVTSGLTLTYYNSAAGTTDITSSVVKTFDPQTVGTHNWYIKQTTSSNCKSNIYTVTVIVKPLPKATISGDTAICYGGNANLSINFSPAGAGDYTYTLSDGSSVQHAVTDPATHSVSPSATTTYTLTALTNNTNGCAAPGGNLTGSAIITVNPLPSVSISPVEFCRGDDVTLTLTGTAPYTLDYTVDGNLPSSVGLSSSLSIPNNSVTVTASSVIGATLAGASYNIELTSLTDANGCAASLPFSQQITVKDRPTIAESLTAFWNWSPVCEETPFDIEAKVNHYLTTEYKGGMPQSSYWIIATAAGGTDPYALTYAPLSRPFTPTFADNAKWIGLVAVNECGTDTVFAQLGVKQKPVLHNYGTTVCSGDIAVMTPPHSGDVIPQGTLFAWDRGAINANNTTNTWGDGSNPQWASDFEQTLTNLTNSIVSQDYYLRANNGGCISDPATCTVTLKPKPSITHGPYTYTVCSGGTFTFAPDARDIVPANIKYTWTVSGSNVTGQSDKTDQLFVSQTLNNTTEIDRTVTYTVTPQSDGCNGADFTVTVTVHPLPRVIITQPAGNPDIALCEGENCTLRFVGNPNFRLDYTINNSLPSVLGLGTTFGSGDYYMLQQSGQTYTVDIPAGTPGTFTFKLTKIEDGNGCISQP